MFRYLAALTIVGMVVATPDHAEAAQQPSGSAPTQAAANARAVVDRYCVTCHNQRLKTGALALDTVDLSNVGANAERLEKVVRKLRAGAMPPPGAPRPDRTAYDGLVGWLETQLDRASASPRPGHSEALHRLNRAEYQNAVRDLLDLEGLDIPLMLPADDASYGFDNIAGVLGISPTHLERYLSAARKISRAAVGDVTQPPTGETRMIVPDLSQDGRMDDLPLGSRGGTLVRRYFPVDGEYVIRFQSVTGVGTAEKERNHLEVTVDGERVFFTSVEQKTSDRQQNTDGKTDTDYEVRVPIRGGLRDVGITYVQTTSAELEDFLQPYQRPPGVSAFKLVRVGGYGGPYVSWVSFTGPLNATGPGDTPSRRRIFTCRPGSRAQELPCAKTILTTLARRGYRRPATPMDLDRLLVFYNEGYAAGGFDRGIQIALERLLASPQFLFRIARDPVATTPGTAYRLSDVELASRLSFFLWSSIPDDELIDVAARGRLREPAVLEQQVRRMLADPRAEALVGNFAGQWLRLRNVKGVLPDSRQFPDFDENLRQAFRRETELFFGSIIREDRSVLTLLNADYTFLNERLARHYGIGNVYGSHFRRVPLDDPRRGGLLGQGSILTVTSQANRTSPVVRGKWILENLLGAPPPPPPPDVPPLEETHLQGTLRQRMEQHRKNPVCASCHRAMDPLGFALENYDAVGAWRTVDAGMPVDAEGSLPDGTSFRGADGLRTALLTRPDAFVMTLTEKLLTYALGRGLEFYDGPAVRAIVRDAGRSDYRFSSVIAGIIKSVPFQMRQSAPGAAPVTSTDARQ